MTCVAVLALVVALRVWCLADRAMIEASLAHERALLAQRTAEKALEQI